MEARFIIVIKARRQKTSMREFFKYLFLLLTYQGTGNEAVDTFVFYSSTAMEIAAAVGVIVLLIVDKPLRKHERTQEKLIFAECILVLLQNLLDLSLIPLLIINTRWSITIFDIFLTVNEMLYIMIIFQWLVCVDYCLYRSKDHLKMRYRFAAIPVLLVVILQIVHDLVILEIIHVPIKGDNDDLYFFIVKMAIELFYVMMAVNMVIKYEKVKREPRFLRISAFIIPFILGALFRNYDAPLLAYGVIITYAQIRRRNKFFNYKLGFYKDGYLDYLSKSWDKKGIKDSSALIISAAGHEEELAQILRDIEVPDCFIISMDNGNFLMISGVVRESAVRLTNQMLRDEAMEAREPFEVVTKSLRRRNGQSMKGFIAFIRETNDVFPPIPKGGGIGA